MNAATNESQKFWDQNLTHKGREKALLAVGRAAGYQYANWQELPADLKRQLSRLWGRK